MAGKGMRLRSWHVSILRSTPKVAEHVARRENVAMRGIQHLECFIELLVLKPADLGSKRFGLAGDASRQVLLPVDELAVDLFQVVLS